nr:hypothetical protein [Tanacetum cinerariifolium]
MKKAITIARIFNKKVIERFSNLTKEDAVKFLQDLATDYAKEKLKNYLEEKIQGLLQGKDEKKFEVMTKTPPITEIIKQLPFFLKSSTTCKAIADSSFVISAAVEGSLG